jgi:PAS domain S-box-containing protein
MRVINEYQLNRLKIVYGIALSIIAITIISSSCLMMYSIKRNGRESRVINLSGRQRMLSQRITKCVLALERTSSPAERSLRSAELVESFTAWKTAHAGLQFGDEKLGLPRRENSPQIKKLFAEIAPFHREMVRAVDRLLASMKGNHTDPALLHETSDLLLTNEPHFLSLMDKLTFQFDREARERVNSMLFLEKIILIVGLMVLSLEFLFVFRPSIYQLSNLMAAIKKKSEQLKESNSLLQESLDNSLRGNELLREHYQFLEVLINAIPSPVFYKDANGIYLGCNMAFEQYLGRARKEIINKTDYDLAPKEVAEKYHAMDLALFEKPGIQKYETSSTDGDSVRHEFIIIKAAYFKTEGTVGGVIGIMVDVTDRRKNEEERLKMDKLESLGVLAGGIAHDYNNILTGIVGNLSLAKLQIDPSHKIIKRLELCEKAANQATKLTRQLLTFARGGEPMKKLINPVSLIRETVSFALRGSDIRCNIDIQNNLWSMEVDESQLNQVLNNLLLNAAQSMPGGGEATVRAENEALLHDNLHQLTPGDYIRIAVEDRGYGITQENLVKIFDPYFTTKSKGSGLGLASVFSIVKRHGGAIEVSSTPGEGTTFTVHLPATPSSLPEDACTNESGELKGSGKVLVMDDEEIIREIAAHILGFMGYEVESCSDGREAIECFRAARENNMPFAYVILDLTIPGGMGGKEAAARILEIDRDAVLIVSSGYSDDPVVANFRQYGFSGVVPKPFDAEGLARELKRLIPNNR